MRNQSYSSSHFALSLWVQLSALGALLLLTGCAQLSFPTTAGTTPPAEIEAEPEPETAETSPRTIPEPQEDPEPDKLYEWNGSGRNISHVVIDTNEQRARFYDGQEQVGWTTIASGVSSHPTPSGEFEVLEKVAKKRSNLYGRIYNAKGGLHKRNARSSDPIPAGGKFVGARMPHFMRMTYDGIGMHAGAIPRPGQPASHGCIRLPDEIASNLFAHTGIGTRVTVIGQGPDYGNYAERVRRQREQERLNRVAMAKAKAEVEAEAETSSRAAPATLTSAAKQSTSRRLESASQPRSSASARIGQPAARDNQAQTASQAPAEEIGASASSATSSSITPPSNSAENQAPSSAATSGVPTTDQVQASTTITTPAIEPASLDNTSETRVAPAPKPTEQQPQERGSASHQTTNQPTTSADQPSASPAASTPAPAAQIQQITPSDRPAPTANLGSTEQPSLDKASAGES